MTIDCDNEKVQLIRSGCNEEKKLSELNIDITYVLPDLLGRKGGEFWGRGLIV